MIGGYIGSTIRIHPSLPVNNLHAQGFRSRVCGLGSGIDSGVAFKVGGL